MKAFIDERIRTITGRVAGALVALDVEVMAIGDGLANRFEVTDPYFEAAFEEYVPFPPRTMAGHSGTAWDLLARWPWRLRIWEHVLRGRAEERAASGGLVPSLQVAGALEAPHAIAGPLSVRVVVGRNLCYNQ